MLHPEGEIHITLKKGEPYDSWGLVRLGNDKGGKLRLKNSFDFDPSLYPGCVASHIHTRPFAAFFVFFPPRGPIRALVERPS